MPPEDAFVLYKAYLEALTVDRVRDIQNYVSENVTFRDPIHDVTGSVKMRRIFERLFAIVSDIEFHIDSHATNGRIVFFRWILTGLLSGKRWTVEGVTRLSFDDQGMVTSHLEYWDAASQLYDRFPVIGSILRWLRRRIANA
ncbi:MAG: nuclear transport factor 2 family protein [Rhodospirillales bacterium]